MTRVLALPRYTHKGASSRLRTLQYIDELSRRGIEFRLESLLDDVYLDDLYAGRGVRSGGASCARMHTERRCAPDRRFRRGVARERGVSVASRRGRALLLDGTPTGRRLRRRDFSPLRPAPVALGAATARRKIDAVMRHAAVVIAGNDYLAERARSAGARRIEIVPTAVDSAPLCGARSVARRRAVHRRLDRHAADRALPGGNRSGVAAAFIDRATCVTSSSVVRRVSISACRTKRARGRKRPRPPISRRSIAG